ncbi:Mfa1 family fimbria major subunit [Bacteroides fragilis]|uniref:Mfa1 family fimbria major subunit n=1 Tax=Bacteroides fragilis TaxID=817 RepID=UPI0032EC1385
MKKNLRHIRLFGTAFLACLFGAACQGDIDTGSNDGQAPVQTAEGYVKVDINLPVTTGVGTRALSYGNGTPAEYQVNDAIIVFFEGASESEAAFRKAYTLTNLDWNTANSDGAQVTTTSHPYVTEAPKAAVDGNKIYALMVLNPNNVLTVSGDKLMQGTTDVFGTNKNVSALQEVLKEQKVKDYTNKGDASSFFMTSAPLSNKSSEAGDFGTATASILTEVEVYDTEEEAAAPGNNPDQIYVERIVAKVSMAVNGDIIKQDQQRAEGNTVIQVKDGAYTGDELELTGWVLNVTNKSTKLVRDVQNFNTWIGYANNKGKRFVESAPVKTNANLYRINWAIDGNYSDGYTNADEFNTWTEGSNEPETGEWNTDFIENGDVAYCFENTFNSANMKQNQTTGLLIKGVYTHNDETEEEDFFVVGNQAAALTFEQFVQIVKEKVPALNDKEITLKEADGGYYNVNRDGRKLSDLLTVTDYQGTDLNNVIDAIGEVKYYKDGATYYYTSLIRHFSDEETQWNNGDDYTDANHLGRYGVVRNTWYKLTINSISGPGEPEIPVIPDKQDDEKQGYIKMEVNILAWAVRGNDIDL